MDVLGSEYNSGCESGWTLYFEQSFLSPNPSHKQSGFVDGRGFYAEEHKEKRVKHEDYEEEDLSMVSDASSGPPHFHEDDDYFNDNNGCSYPASMNDAFLKNSGKKQKTKEHQRRKEEHQPSLLDDTASSPFFNFSKNNFTLANNQASMESMLDFSQGFSATHYENGSAFQNHLGILQSPLSGNQLQQNQWY